MNKTYNYQPKFSFGGALTPVAAFIVIAILLYVFKYGIALGSLPLLLYPNSVYVSVGLAILFLIGAIIKYRKVSAAKRNPNKVELTPTTLSYPKGANDKVIIELNQIVDIMIRDSEGDKTLLVHTPKGGPHEFEEENFESKAHFSEFADTLENYIQKEKS